MAGVKHFSELAAWRHARDLRRTVYSLCTRPAVQTDFGFRNQIIDAARSPARNIAEGFGRFRPRDFSRFLKIASSSIYEVENHLDDGIDLGYWTREEATPAFVLCKRAGSAIGGLQRYLSSCDPKFDTGRVPDPRDRKNPRTSGTRTPRTEPMEPSEPLEPEEPS